MINLRVHFSAAGLYWATLDSTAQGVMLDKSEMSVKWFGVNLVFIEPGSASSLRHYHMEQDEFAMITEGELVLVENDEETVMRVGDCVAWPAGVDNGHCLENRTDTTAAFLVVGTRTETETAYYSDMDMMVKSDASGFHFTKKDGRPLTADQIGDEND